MQCKLHGAHVNLWTMNVMYILYLSQYWGMCAGHAAYLQYRDISTTCGCVSFWHVLFFLFFFWAFSLYAKAYDFLFFYLVTLHCGLNWTPPPPPPPKLKPLVVCWIVIFCVVTPWNLVDSFRGACCLCLQDRRTVLSDEGTGFSKLLFLIYQSSCYHIQEDSDVITIVCCLCFPASLYSVYDVWINRITVHIFVCFMVQVEVFDIVKMGQQRVYWHHL